MHAVNLIEGYLSRFPNAASARSLAELTVALERDEMFSLERLFEMDYEAFELALGLLSEWRIDRFFADRIGLLDKVKATLRTNAPSVQAVA